MVILPHDRYVEAISDWKQAGFGIPLVFNITMKSSTRNQTTEWAQTRRVRFIGLSI